MSDSDFATTFERYRALLHLRVRQARIGLGGAARFDGSDVVQEVFLKAQKAADQLRGRTEPEVIAWLSAILTNVLIDLHRRHQASKCDPARERSIDAILAESSARLDAILAASQTSPSDGVQRREELLRMATAIEQLPDDQREAVVAHHLLGMSVMQVSQQLGKTEKAIAGLLFRGMKGLRSLLHSDDGRPPK